MRYRLIMRQYHGVTTAELVAHSDDLAALLDLQQQLARLDYDFVRLEQVP